MRNIITIVKLFMAIILLILIPNIVKSEQWKVPDSCLKMELPNDILQGYFNPDSILLDTCYQSPTFEDLYAKYKFLIQIKHGEYFFKQKPVPIDTFITIADIDTTYAETKKGFQNLEEQFGKFYFLRAWPTISDSFHLINPIFYIYFDKYTHVKTVVTYLRNIQNINDATYDIQYGRNASDINENFNNYFDSKIILIEKLPFLLNINKFEIKKIKLYNIYGILIPDNNCKIINNNILFDNMEIGIYFLIINSKIVYKIIIW